MASVGRYAAGFVGLLEDGDFKLQQRGFYASLVRPPRLEVRLSPDGQAVVNLDASRLINGGAIASGGGHSLVFRDDVIHLLWPVIRLTPT